jgi:iron complex outermembrane receptor protein
VTPEYVKDFNYLESTRGDYDVYLLAGKNRMQNMIWQGMLQGKVRTGPFEHKLVFGAERQTLNYDADMGGFYQYFGAGNIYADNPVSYTGSVADWQMFRAIEYVQSAFYASDTMTLSRHWSVLGGLRYNNYEQTDLDPDGSISDRYKKNGTLTPTVALMYKPDDATTFYASYVEALESGGIVGSRYANANEMLKPLKSRQYEIGVKHEADYWTASAALFRMERAAAYANAQNYYVQDGLAVYQGLEVSGAIHPVRNLTLGGGLMLLDARFRRGAAYNGNRISGDPKLVATAYVNYDVPQVPGLGLYADVKFSGKTYADSANTLSNGGQALIGVGASYATRVAGHPTTYQVSINNLTDRRGWVGGSSQILPLSPRTFMLNAKFEF